MRIEEMSVAEQAKAMKEKLTDAEINQVDGYRTQLVGELEELLNKVVKNNELEIPTEEDIFDQQRVNPIVNLADQDKLYDSDRIQEEVFKPSNKKLIV